MTKIPKEYLVLGLGTLLSIIVFFGVGAGSSVRNHWLCVSGIQVVPGYRIEDEGRRSAMAHLLGCVCLLRVIESFSDFLLYWIPFYYAFKVRSTSIDLFIHAGRGMLAGYNVSRSETPISCVFKLAFLLWMMLPQTMGAKFLYECFLRDFLKKNESKIDSAFADASKTTSSVANNVGASVTDAVNAATSEEVKKDN